MFEHLHQKYAQLLKQFFLKRGANSDLADDLVQKIFTSLWQRHKNNLKEDYFEAYLYHMARNTLYNEIRRSKRMAGINSIKHSKFGIPTHRMLSQPEAVLYLKELNDALEKAKTGLTNDQYKALQLAQNPDADFHRALEELGWSIEVYKSHLKRAPQEYSGMFKTNVVGRFKTQKTLKIIRKQGLGNNNLENSQKVCPYWSLYGIINIVKQFSGDLSVTQIVELEYIIVSEAA